jgi:hypothetical protein
MDERGSIDLSAEIEPTPWLYSSNKSTKPLKNLDTEKETNAMLSCQKEKYLVGIWDDVLRTNLYSTALSLLMTGSEVMRLNIPWNDTDE